MKGARTWPDSSPIGKTVAAPRRAEIVALAMEGADSSRIGEQMGLKSGTVRAQLRFARKLDGIDIPPLAERRKAKAPELIEAGKTVTEIAELWGCSEVCVRSYLNTTIPERKHEKENKMLRAAELRAEGVPLPEIARRLKITLRTTSIYIQRALKRGVAPRAGRRLPSLDFRGVEEDVYVEAHGLFERALLESGVNAAELVHALVRSPDYIAAMLRPGFPWPLKVLVRALAICGWRLKLSMERI